MPILFVAAITLIVLHRADGGEVTVAASQITSLRNTHGSLRDIAPHTNCIVGMTDGKFVGVLEACNEIKRQLEAR
jgi:hypothetical protein